jgi:hypothetical protein
MIIVTTINSPKYVVLDCSIESHEEIWNTYQDDSRAQEFLDSDMGEVLVLYKRISKHTE